MLTYFKKLLFAFKESINSHPELYPLTGTVKDVNLENAAEDYINNYKKMDKISNENKGKYFNFLQPFNYGGNRQLTSFDVASTSHIKRIKTKEGITQADVILNYFSILSTKIKNHNNIFNLQNIFDQPEEEIFLDQVHISNIGFDKIAKVITEKILENENE